MTTTTSEKVRLTTADLDLFPDDGKRYEIIDGELFVTRAPHWKHQEVCVKIGTEKVSSLPAIKKIYFWRGSYLNNKIGWNKLESS